MKPYQSSNGKGMWSEFWKDYVPRRIRKVFKKSARQLNKKYEISDLE